MDDSSVVLLASFPRSGNTLFRQVLEQCYGVPTYTVYKTEDKVLWADRVWPHDAQVDQDVYFVKTHRLERHDGPIIYIVRDGRDTLLSFWKYRRPLYEMAHELMDGTWAAHVRWYLEQDCTVVKFEDMLPDPIGVVTEAVQAVGFDIQADPPGELTDFETLHAQDPNFWRSGKVGQWRDELTAEVHDAFWAVNGLAMEALGYER